jgi:uncharacterized lipoprotein YehR (DUF1307 family)
MAELKLRIDDMTKAGIQKLARKKGISMNEYVDTLLRDHVLAPDRRALEDKYAKTLREVAAAYQNLVGCLKNSIDQGNELTARYAELLNKITR